ncbi:MAG TPA: biotin transporter BioY [Desulfonatronum sp.]|nr:biotin transporter BioY [Desulfonatronum sp.]
MHSTPLQGLHTTVWTALLAALIALGSFLSLPLGPVPFSMQPFFVMMAGFILGWPYAMTAALLFVASGIIGLPVFAGGKSGLAVLLGPTGGYVLGFVPAAGCIGLLTRARKPGWIRGLAAGVAGLALLYACGLFNLMRVMQIGWNQALAVGFLPFILQDLVKLALAVATWRSMHRRGLLPW